MNNSNTATKTAHIPESVKSDCSCADNDHERLLLQLEQDARIDNHLSRLLPRIRYLLTGSASSNDADLSRPWWTR